MSFYLVNINKRKKFCSLVFLGIVCFSANSKPADAEGIAKSVAFFGHEEKEPLFVLKENLWINTAPVSFPRPFYENSSDKFSIKQLSPKAEHLYFTNIKAKKQTRTFDIQENGLLYINSDYVNKEVSRVKLPQRKSLGGKAIDLKWEYDRGFNTTTAYYTDSRQWLKNYEEPVFEVVQKGSHVFLRDEYSIKCLEIDTGFEKWDIKVNEASRPDLYQTFHPPHQNARGFLLSEEKDIIFAELFGTLMAVSIADIDRPMPLWKKSLGEFRSVTKPIVLDEVLTMAATNPTGELWVIGFSVLTGDVLWTEYIGLSSFLSPMSIQVIKNKDYVYLGTNQGALIAVDPKKGAVVWIRKYEPTKYAISEYWKQKKFRYMLQEEGSIPFAGSLLRFDKEGRIIHKPREGRYLSFINQSTGALNEEIPVTKKGYVFMGLCNDNLVFFQKNEEKSSKIIVMDPESKQAVFEYAVSEGRVLGSQSYGDSNLFLKIEETLYHLQCPEDVYECVEIKTDVAGWLIPSNSSTDIFLSDGNKLLCLGHKASDVADGTVLSDEIKIRDFLMKFRNQSLPSEDFSKNLENFCRDHKITRDEFIEKSILHEDLFTDKNGLKLAKRLSQEFNEAFVKYKGISVRVPAFFSVIAGIVPSEEQGQEKEKKEDYSNLDYTIRAAKISLLQAINQNPNEEQDCYFVLSHDQLLCVEEDGSIRWETKVFFNPVALGKDNRHKDQFRGRLYADRIEAYIKGNTLIVNDGVNVSGFDIQKGYLRWSMTTRDDFFAQERMLPFEDNRELFKEKSISKNFLDKIEKKILFVREKMFIVYRNTICRVDPQTGFCEEKTQLEVEGFMAAISDESQIYLIDSRVKQLFILDENCVLTKKLDLDFLNEKDIYVELRVANNIVYIRTDDSVYAIDRESFARIKLPVMQKEDNPRWGWDVYGPMLLITYPLESVQAYSITNGQFVKRWQAQNDYLGRKIFWHKGEPTGKQPKFYFMHQEKLYFFKKREKDFSLTAHDVYSGKLLWETMLPVGEGLFYNLSPSVFDEEHKRLIFILTYNVDGDKNPKRLIPEKTRNHVRSWLMMVDYTNGGILQKKELPKISGYRRGFRRVTITETSKTYVFTIHGRFLTVIKK